MEKYEKLFQRMKLAALKLSRRGKKLSAQIARSRWERWFLAQPV